MISSPAAQIEPPHLLDVCWTELDSLPRLRYMMREGESQDERDTWVQSRHASKHGWASETKPEIVRHKLKAIRKAARYDNV